MIKAVFDALRKGDLEEAATKAQEATMAAEDKGNKALAAHAKEATARVVLAKGQSSKEKYEAREVAQHALNLFRELGDVTGEASTQLLLADVCIATARNKDAISAAKESLRLFRTVADKAGQADAFRAIAAADCDNERGEGVLAAQERAKLYKETGEQRLQAAALLALAELHVARMGRKLASCRIASADDTIAALQAAKDAYALFALGHNHDGQASSMRTIAHALLYNGVSPDVVERATDPEDIFQDVMSGKYTSAQNALPSRPMSKTLKLEEVVPSSKQLDRGRFAWNDPTAGYSYRLIWQPAKDREARNRKPRGSYDILALNTSSKTMAIPAIFGARSHDASEKNDALVVHVISHDCCTAYASTLMSTLNTISAMITARLNKLSFVQLGESHYDWTDTRVRQVNMAPVTLALLRSSRIEAPHITIGFVAGDAPSWMADPAPLIESIFDTVESEECELMYKRGDAFAPLMIHAPMEDTVQYVLPWKKNKSKNRQM